jgi:hypothetical protein
MTDSVIALYVELEGSICVEDQKECDFPQFDVVFWIQFLEIDGVSSTPHYLQQSQNYFIDIWLIT